MTFYSALLRKNYADRQISQESIGNCLLHITVTRNGVDRPNPGI